MHVLVTGAAGFIGSNYVRNLLRGAYPGIDPTAVTVVDRFTEVGNIANLEPIAEDPRLRIVQGDIVDEPAVDKVMDGAELVINFAAESHVDRSIVNAAEFVRSNVVGTQVLLAAALRHGVRRFVQVSTDEVYGSIESGSWTETWPLEPSSPYAASKASADLLVRSYHRTFGLDTIITRCSNNYGPYQYPEKIIPLFVTNLLEGKKIPLYGDGRNVREWIHVDDHCRGIQLAAESGRAGEIYHIGGGVELSNIELTRRILDACGAGTAAIDYVDDRPGHDLRYSLDDSKLRALGYRPQVSIDEGLAATIAWYQDNPPWWMPLKHSELIGVTH